MLDTPDWREKTILVVEDEEVNQYFFKTALKLTNAKLLFAKTGLEGIAMVHAHCDIDCVLMDVRLPEMDGFEATKNIKEKRKDLPIIIQTAYVLSIDRNRAFESGCDEFLPKPIQVVNLIDVLKKFIG